MVKIFVILILLVVLGPVLLAVFCWVAYRKPTPDPLDDWPDWDEVD